MTDIDDGGERRFEHERLDRALQGKPRGDPGPERFAVGHDVAGRHADILEIVVGRGRVGNVVGLRRPSRRTAIAAVIEHEHAVAARGDGLDLARPVCC